MALLLLSGLTLTLTTAPPGAAQISPPMRAASVDPYAAHVVEASRRFDIPASWITAVMQAESAGDKRAMSPNGAMGLMQVMPGTWAELRVRHGLGLDPYDPRANILAGTAYLREMWDRYGDVPAMLAAYNAGPASYDEHRASDHPLPAETRAYLDALAPALRGERPSRSRRGPSPPVDWREASVFVMREIGASATDPAPPARSGDDTHPLVPAASTEFLGPQSKGLFVIRQADGNRP